MRLIIGPFCGEIGWEFCYWQAHIRWLKEMSPEEIEFLPVTFPGRQPFYRDFVDTVAFHSDMVLDRFGRQDCYNSQGVNRRDYFAYVGALVERHHAYGAVTTPNHDGRFYIPTDKMIFRKFEPVETLKYLVDLPPVKRKSVMIFPRKKGDGRDWPEANWVELIYQLSKAGYGVVIGGVRNASCLIDYKGDGIVNLMQLLEGDPFHALDLVLHYLTKVRMAVGSQSALPILSMHQEVPTLMWGGERERHEKELNYFDTPCRFLDDPKYAIAPERVIEELKIFEKEVK